MFSQKQKYLALIILSIILTASITTVAIRAVTTAPSTLTISSGVYPGAPTYTIWNESAIYYTKDANGLTVDSGSDASTVIINAIGNCSGTHYSKIVFKGYFTLNYHGTSKGTQYCILLNKDRVLLDFSEATFYLANYQNSTMLMVDDPLVLNSTDSSYEEAITFIGIEGGRFIGNRLMQSDGYGILFNYTRKSWIRNTLVENCSNANLCITGYYSGTTARFSVENDFSNMKLYYGSTYGFYTILAADNRYTDLYVQQSYAEGVYVYCSSNQFVNLHIYDCCTSGGQAGLRVNGDNNHFWHSESDKPNTRAIRLESGANGNIFTDTWIFELASSATYEAIQIIAAEYCIFNGGRIQDGNVSESGACDHNLFTDLIISPDYLRSIGANSRVESCWNATAWV